MRRWLPSRSAGRFRFAWLGPLVVGTAVLGGCAPDLDLCYGLSCGERVPPPQEIHVRVFAVPHYRVVQVGEPVVLRTNVTASSTVPLPYSYRWCRAPSRDEPCVEIPGATEATYTLAGPSLADDRALFGVTVRGGEVEASAQAEIGVSDKPPVTYADGEFDSADWSADALVEPAGNVATHTEARVADGGHPGAYRELRLHLPSGTRMTVFHRAATVGHDPATQGALYAVEFGLDALQVTPALQFGEARVDPMIEQGGRRYLARSWNLGWIPGDGSGWVAAASGEVDGRLGASDFVLVDGTPCAATEACPDFSATAPLLRFGLAHVASWHGTGAASVVLGIDDWSMTVWRR
jgi:hypothetical protein